MNYDIELEQSVLGCLIHNNDYLSLLDESYFHAPEHQAIFRKIKSSSLEAKTETVITLGSFFTREPSLVALGGKSYLKELLEVKDVLFAKESIKTLRDLAITRGFEELSEKIKKASEEAKSPQEIKDLILAHLEEVSFTESKEPQDVLKLVMDVLKKAETPRKDLLKLGYEELDKIIGGVYDGALITLAGGTGMGKSALALCIALNVAQTQPVLLFSLEMGGDQYAGRIISNIASVNTRRLKQGCLNQYENNSIALNAARFQSLKLKIDDKAEISPQYVKHTIKRQKVKPRLVIVDLLNILKPDSKQQNREREISAVTGALKVIARDLNTPIMLLAQLNREAGKRQMKKPMLADLKDSSSIEQDSDLVIFVHRDEYYLNQQRPHESDPAFYEWQKAMEKVKGKVEVIVAKHRDGPVGEIELKFDPEFSRFTELNNF